MSYSTSTILKAVGAAVAAFIGAAATAAGGPDLSHLSIEQWFSALGPALVAGFALLHTPSGTAASAPVNPAANAALTVAEAAAQAVAAHAQLTQTAVDSIAAVQAAVGQLAKVAPVVGAAEGVVGTVTSDVQAAANALGLGPLASQVIKSIPKI